MMGFNPKVLGTETPHFTQGDLKSRNAAYVRVPARMTKMCESM